MKYQALQPATDEMHDCWSLLTATMLDWPGVRMYHLFGTCAFYHRKEMFAMLPDKRSLDSANAMNFKTAAEDPSDPQDNWHSFELTSRSMVGAALVSLEKAYHDSKLAFSAQMTAV